MLAASGLRWRLVCVRCSLRRLTKFTGLLEVSILLLALVPATRLYGDAAEYEGKPLAAIRFNPAEQPLTEADLKQKIQALKTGQPFHLADVRNTIEALFSSGRYENIIADAAFSATEPGSGVVLTFQTTQSRFIRGVVITGVSDPPNQGQLVNATKLQLGQPYNRTQLRQATESLLELLRLNGFYQAKVSNQTEEMKETEQVDVTFDVDTGKRARFATPIIKGQPNKNANDIISATRWKRFFGLGGGWREVTEARVQSGLDRVRRSYQKKEYLQAKVTLDQMDYDEESNTAVPILTIEGGPKVIVRINGAKVSDGKRRQILPIYQEQSVDKDLLVEGQRNLEEYFQSQGYFEADVTFDVTSDDKGQQVIEYNVDRGAVHKLVALEIQGNRYFDTATIRERMYVTPANLLRFRHGRYSPAYLKRDINAIKDLYQSNGFRDIDIEQQVIDDYQGKDKDVAVMLRINEGAQSFVHSVQFKGISADDQQQLGGMIQSSVGQPFSDINVANDQESILNYYFNSGYPDATFEAQVKPADVPNRMDLVFVIHPGNRQFIRQVLISGLKQTDPALVTNRIRNLEPGEPLSQASTIESQRRMYDLSVFARVDTALQNPDGDEAYKYVLYRFEEASKYFISGGVGAQIGRIGAGSVNTFDAPAGKTGFSPRVSLGISRINFLGLAHTIGVQTRLSDVQRRVLANYTAPQFKGRDNLNLSLAALYDDSRDVRTFNAKRQEASVQLGQRLTKANTIQYRLAYRRVTVDKNSLQISPGLIPLLSQPVQLGIISTSFIQDRRDDPGDSHKGIYNAIDVGFASNLFGSKTSFVRVLARNSTYHRITKDLVIARSFSFGVEEKVANTDVPLPERFFAGGSASQRGFSENQAGPRDLETGYPVGGKALLLNNTELRFPLIGDNIGGVLFHDAGNVYTNAGAVSFRFRQKDVTDFDYMVQAFGFGVRYRTPIGPVRVDFGYALNPPAFYGFKGSRDQLYVPNPDPSLRVYQRLSHFTFHFSLGQAF